MAVGRKAVFCDKDGTLIRDVPYNVSPDYVKLYPGVGQSLKRLQEAGYYLFVISNQSGIAKGLFKKQDLEKLSTHLRRLLKKEFDVSVDGFYYCPHDPADGCFCRKPLPGLIRQAASDNKIVLSQSWMIGDILNDIEAGNTAGCRSILIDNGNETEWLLNGNLRRPEYTAQNFPEAADYIIQNTPKRRNYEKALSFDYQKV